MTTMDVLIVAPKIDTMVEEIARSLQYSHSRIRVLTARDSTVPTGQKFETLTYFRDWNALEALKLLPRLLPSPPKIFHFIQPEGAVPAAYPILTSFALALPGAKIITSVTRSRTTFPSRWLLRWMSSQSHLVTLAHESLQKTYAPAAASGAAEVWPLQSFAQVSRSWPNHNGRFSSPWLLAAPRRKDFALTSKWLRKLSAVHSGDLVVENLGEWGQRHINLLRDELGERFRVLGVQERHRIPGVRGIFVAHASLDWPELSEYAQLALIERVPLYVNPNQASQIEPGVRAELQLAIVDHETFAQFRIRESEGTREEVVTPMEVFDPSVLHNMISRSYQGLIDRRKS
jgi:hypothetical protein